MSEEIDIFKCLDYIRINAPLYAQAKANRIYIEQYRKTKKALLMNEVEGPQHVKEAYAYAHKSYQELLKNYETAIKNEEEHKFMMIAAQAKVEVFRTLQANNRFLDSRAA